MTPKVWILLSFVVLASSQDAQWLSAFVPNDGNGCADDVGTCLLFTLGGTACGEPVGSMCKKTCNKCGDTAAQCIDHSAICAFRATGPFKEASCSKDHIRRDCPMSCGACTVPPNAIYMGCYIDADRRDMTGKYTSLPGELNIAECASICNREGYGFMGLQYGKECYCGDDYGKYGSVPDEECNKPCDGANDQMCGGTWRQSIYSLGTSRCSDKVEGCQRLKDEGKCESDPTYMMTNCKRTCDACFVDGEDECSCWGDPHCFSFDGKTSDYQGHCIYTMAQDGCGDGYPVSEPNFEIIADFKVYTGNKNLFSMAKEIYIKLNDRGYTVFFGQDGIVEINGAPVDLPYIGNGILVYRRGELSTILDMRLGFLAEHGGRWNDLFKLKVRDSYKSNMCGICGDYNDDPANDFTTGPRCGAEDSPGSVVEDEFVFGNSWRADDFFDSDTLCDDNRKCEVPPLEDRSCTTVERQQGADKCDKIRQFIDSDADAKECLDILSNDLDRRLISDCVFDVCLTKEDKYVCSSLEALASECKEKLAIVVKYQSENLCPEVCKDENERFIERCGLCEKACTEENVDPFCDSLNNQLCRVSCECNQNYRRHNGICVPKAECTSLLACDVPGSDFPLPSGESFVKDNCGQICECTAGELVCRDYACTDGKVCIDDKCRCDKGFMLNPESDSCFDINECESVEEPPCKGDGNICENNEGSYSCECSEGFAMNDAGDCENINECEENSPCGDNAECLDITPGYECRCSNGFAMVGEVCQDVNECETAWNDCDADTADCVNTEGSFSCECKEGFTKVDSDKRCYDINECQFPESPCGDNSRCENDIGSFTCVCNAGYRMNEVTYLCENIDECAEFLDRCDFVNADCTDTPGSYTCECHEGFSGDGETCIEILVGCDPEVEDFCTENAICSENPEESHFDCYCLPGYVGNGYELCEDVNECLENTDKCSPNADCVNADGSYSCTCHEGFAGDGFICSDINECVEGQDECDDLVSDCQNTVGGYTCRCKTGFMLNQESQQCEDVDECDTVDCGENAVCSNSVGSYKCQCTTGFSGSCGNCVNDNECGTGKNVCHEDADCQDTIGSYSCSCKEGYVGNGIDSCQASDACASGTDNCDENAICVFDNPGFSCVCYPGYSKNEAGICANINECASAVSGCAVNADCTDTDGSFECSCKLGFAGDGISCAAAGVVCVDQVCDFNAICDEGRCRCMDGFEGDGIPANGRPGCIDVNECTNGEAICAENAVCVNVLSMYMCLCKDGFAGDGETACEPQPENPCSGNKCAKGTLCDSSSGEAVCGCPDGLQLSKRSGCFDLNECLTGDNDKCPENSQCVNKNPGYTCSCGQGYTYDKVSNICKDINECYVDDDLCSPEAECLNTDGGYQCRCFEGYKGDGFTCQKPDSGDCLPGACGDNAYCSGVTEGQPICRCQLGFQNLGSDASPDCLDINECLTGDNRCSSGADCNNKAGSYSCQCREGYRGNGVLCRDINECDENPDACPGGAFCVNQDGAFGCIAIEDCGCGSNGRCNDGAGAGMCICNPGYEEVDFLPLNKCQDVDQCMDDPCEKADFRMCRDLPGDFECICAVGTWDGEQCAQGVCDLGVNCHEHADCIEVDNKPVCRCRDGHQGDGFFCEPIQVGCDSVLCVENSVCVDTASGPECVCNTGFVSGDGGECQDVNECDDNPCGDNAECQNQPGFYQCVCADGFRKSSGSCVNYDECAQGENDCNENADCIDSEGDYSCECREGFVGDGQTCNPDFGCSQNGPCDENAECSEGTDGLYFCACMSGFQGDGLSCEDIPECDGGDNNCHADAICTETPGSYRCECGPGHGGDGHLCDDIDECLEEGVCPGEHAVCLNEPGTFACVCAQGYVKEGDVCVDEDECSAANLGRFCPAPGDCTNTDGSYTCECPEGYKITATGCKDINECALGTHDCDITAENHMRCVNNDGGFTCECQAGYPANDAGVCEEVDECADPDLNKCDENAECTNQPGFYECDCNEGFTGNGFLCFPELDDCENTDCSVPNSICVRKADDSEECVCGSGFRGDPLVECLPFTCDVGSPCPSNTECVNDPDGRGYTCLCKEGFTGTDGNCENINECEQIADLCGENGRCVDLVQGTYRCDCVEGFIDNGGFCDNLNECETVRCAANQACVDTDGGYDCVCADGYRMEGDVCVDNDECSGDVSPCHTDGVCFNVPGTFRCECKQGYEGNGIDCADADECLIRPPVCPEKSECVNIAASYECQCRAGYQYDQEAQVCRDVDECGENPCGEDADCVNLPGTFFCSCQKGFAQGADGQCADIDECGRGADACHENAACTNQPGGYTCACNEGFAGNGFTCSAICEEGTCPYLGQVCRVAEDGQSPDCQCKCRGEECLASGPMCDSNGRTFTSFAEFDKWRCESQSYEVKRAYWGECSDTCVPVRCADYEECVMTDGRPSCVCPPCSDDDRNSGPVCSSFVVTYQSLCSLKTQACRQKSLETYSHSGPCVQDCEVGDWGEYGECSQTCGEGISSRTREVLVAPGAGGDRCPNLLDSQPCFQPPCPDSLCDDSLCERPGAMCLLGEADQTFCECPSGCQAQDESPVCGLLFGREPATFRNLCKLRRVSCLYALPYTVLNEGACDADSSDDSRCRLAPTFEIISSGGCKTQYHVSLAQCEGSCGSDSAMCCKPAGVEDVPVTLTCGDGSKSQQMAAKFSACECVDSDGSAAVLQNFEAAQVRTLDAEALQLQAVKQNLEAAQLGALDAEAVQSKTLDAGAAQIGTFDAGAAQVRTLDAAQIGTFDAGSALVRTLDTDK